MTLYLDMDGVIADFFSGFAHKFGKNHWKEVPDIESRMNDLHCTDFFYILEKASGADELINFAKEYGDWGICSTPLRGDRNNSAFWKRNWLIKHDFMPEIPKLIFTTRKHDYAIRDFDGTPNILVDDKPSNIDKWKAKGGIGILYQADKDDLQDLLHKLRLLLGLKTT